MKTKGAGTAKIINMDDLRAMATHGMTPKQIADYYNLTRQGFNDILNVNPELKQAFTTGLNHVLVKAVRVLMKKLDADDSFAAIYLLNNRGGWCEERYRKEKIDPDSIPRVTIYLPDNERKPVE